MYQLLSILEAVPTTTKGTDPGTTVLILLALFVVLSLILKVAGVYMNKKKE